MKSRYVVKSFDSVSDYQAHLDTLDPLETEIISTNQYYGGGYYQYIIVYTTWQKSPSKQP